MDFDYLVQVIKQKSMLEDPLTQEEHILAQRRIFIYPSFLV